MKLKSLLLALMALPLMFVACEPDNPVEVKEPTVTIAVGEVAQNSISFTITTTHADKVAYLVVEGTEVPSASEVLANGTEIEANNSVEAFALKLKAATEYTIVAAAQNAQSAVKAEVTKTTLAEGEQPGQTTITLKSSSVMNFPAEGGKGEIKYEVTNPIEGAELYVETGAEWIDNLEDDGNGTITFDVRENVAEARESIIFGNYNGDSELEIRVEIKQAAPGETPAPDKTEFVATKIVTDYAYEDGMHIYIFELGDKEWGNNGWGVDGGTYYAFAIIASSKGNGVLPNGTYTLSESYGVNTIMPDYAYRYQMVDGDFANGFEIYKDANLVITDGKIEANIELERDGSIHHVVFEGSLAVEDGGSQGPEEFVATHIADKWYWGGSSNYGYKYSVAGENFSVDVHFQPQNASETAITAGEYIWTTTTMWGYNDFEEFTTRTFTVDGNSVAVDAGIAVVSNEGDEYHIEMTLEGRDGFVYMIEYNGKLNDKEDVGGEDGSMVVTSLGEGSHNSSYFFYTFKGEGENFTFDLLVNDAQANAVYIAPGDYQYAPMKSIVGNSGFFFVDNFKIDGVKYTPQVNSSMTVAGDGTNVEITLNLYANTGDQFVVKYVGVVGGSSEGGSTELVKLDTPTVVGMVSGNAATVSWNEVAGAKDYTVTLNGTDAKTVSTAYVVYENLAWETTYSVEVVANPADAAVNAASDAGTATFTTEANPSSGDEGGNDDTTTEASLKFVKDLTSEYGAGYEVYCYYELTSGQDVIGFWIYNSNNDKHYLYDGEYTNGKSLNHIAYNPGSGVFIENVTIDGQYVSATNNGGAQTSSTIVIANQGGNVTINLDYVDDYAVLKSRTYNFSGVIE